MRLSLYRWQAVPINWWNHSSSKAVAILSASREISITSAVALETPR